MAPVKIDEMHETAAEQIAERVGVVGQNDFSHFRLRAGDGADDRAGSRWNSLRGCSIHSPSFDRIFATIGCGVDGPWRTIPVSAIRAKLRKSVQGKPGTR